MPVNLNPPRGPLPPVVQALAEAALQRQNTLLGTDREGAVPAQAPAFPAPPGAPPAPLPQALPLPVGADQVSLSAQARSSLAHPSGTVIGASPPAPAAPAAPAQPARPAPAGPAGAAPLPPWPATGVSAPLHRMVAALVQQLTAPAQPQRVVAVQPWPAALVPVVEAGGAQEDGLPPLQTWLVRQGMVQTAEGARAFSLTLRVPVPWLQSQAPPPAAPAPAPPLAALFAGRPQALQSGTWALVLQADEPAAGARTSALLALEFAPLAQAAVYGRDLLQARQDPWVQMAVLQASGQWPRDEDAARDREAGLCQAPGCPYAGRAACAQPFCLALRAVPPPDPIAPLPPADR